MVVKKFQYINRISLVGMLMVSLILISSSLSAQSSQDDDYAGRKILVVNSYHQGYEWSDGIEAGILSILDETEVEVEFFRMDTKLNPEPEFGEEVAEEAMALIDEFEPDVVITADDNAQKYLVVPYLLDTQIPVIFVGVNWDASVYGFPADNVTGMIEVELVDELVVQLAEFAEGDEIAYLTITSETEEKVIDTYNERFFDDELEVYSVETYEEFKEAFLEAQDEVDMVFIGNNAGAGEWDEEDAVQFFTENTQVPTGSINSWMAPYSLITLAKSPEEQGEWAAETALAILDGTAIEDIPVTENKRGNLILNLEIAEQMDIIFSPFILRNAEIYEPVEED